MIYYRKTLGFLVTYDVTDRYSFDCVKNWLNNIEKYGNENAIRLLVGNKSDLIKERKVSFEEGQAIAAQHNIGFIETSSKENHNVEEAFSLINKEILTRISQIENTNCKQN
jgi:GTPase SAR1 family protein